ncbi:MAG: aminotransferase class V-fold PLP-dependent enzyme [Caldilinea sp.]
MFESVWLLFALPALGALIILFAGQWMSQKVVGWVASAAVLGAFVVSVMLFFGLTALPAAERSITITWWQWMTIGDFEIPAAVLIDPLSITMAMVVTGVGALIARYDALTKLHRPWFAGGTITITSVQGDGWHALIPGAAGFEDGTVNYLALPAVEIGLRHIERIGIDAIHTRVMALTSWLLETMTALHHSNGARLVHIYGPENADARGGTIAFTLVDPTGEPFDFRRVEAAAGARKISLRTGCFCNPGDGEIAHHLSREEMACYFTGKAPSSFYEFYDLLHTATGKTPSTIRVSLGLASNFADAYTFVQFLTEFVDQRADELPWAPEPTLAAIRQRDAA